MNNRPLPSLVQNPKRRMLLTFGATGVAAFVMGKLFGDTVQRFFSPSDTVVREAKFENFTLTETKGEIVLTDKSGEEIFIVEK